KPRYGCSPPSRAFTCNDGKYPSERDFCARFEGRIPDYHCAGRHGLVGCRHGRYGRDGNCHAQCVTSAALQGRGADKASSIALTAGKGIVSKREGDVLVHIDPVRTGMTSERL